MKKMISAILMVMVIALGCGTIPIPPDATSVDLEVTSEAKSNIVDNQGVPTGEIILHRDTNFAGLKIYVDAELVHTEYMPNAPDEDITFEFVVDCSAWGLGEPHQVGASCFDGVFNEDGSFERQIHESETVIEDVVKVATASGAPTIRVLVR